MRLADPSSILLCNWKEKLKKMTNLCRSWKTTHEPAFIAWCSVTGILMREAEIWDDTLNLAAFCGYEQKVRRVM